MGLYDFVAGILVGIILACVSFVVQTSRISAIRGKLYGGVANSTVRRHPLQNKFLKDAGNQIHVMKLAGYLFFGTIVGVEKQIRFLLEEEAFRQHPIRYLVLDLWNVDGIDYSAAETFLRINRILNGQGVELVICGMELIGEAGRALQNVGMFSEDNGVTYFQSLNSALEFCENELLKAFYHQRDAEAESESTPAYLGERRIIKKEQESLIVQQRFQNLSTSSLPRLQTPSPHRLVDTTYIRSPRRPLAGRIQLPRRSGKITPSRRNLFCKHSVRYLISQRSSGTEQNHILNEESMQRAQYCTTLEIVQTAFIFSRAEC